MEHLPALENLHLRHPGVTQSQAGVFAEAAAVALDRHHTSPLVLELSCATSKAHRQIEWQVPDDRLKGAYRNQIETTETAAYGVCLAAIECEMGLVGLSRTDQLSGADYWIGPPNATSLEEARRLEVSGVDNGDLTSVGTRVRMKIAQVTKPSSDAWAVGVLGVRTGIVRIEQSD